MSQSLISTVTSSSQIRTTVLHLCTRNTYTHTLSLIHTHTSTHTLEDGRSAGVKSKSSRWSCGFDCEKHPLAASGGGALLTKDTQEDSEIIWMNHRMWHYCCTLQLSHWQFWREFKALRNLDSERLTVFFFFSFFFWVKDSRTSFLAVWMGQVWTTQPLCSKQRFDGDEWMKVDVFRTFYPFKYRRTTQVAIPWMVLIVMVHPSHWSYWIAFYSLSWFPTHSRGSHIMTLVRKCQLGVNQVQVFHCFLLWSEFLIHRSILLVTLPVKFFASQPSFNHSSVNQFIYHLSIYSNFTSFLSSIHPTLHHSFHPFIHVFIQSCIHLSSIHFYILPSIHSFIHQSIRCLLVYLSFLLSFMLSSIYLSSIHPLSIFPSIYPLSFHPFFH